MRFSKDRSGSVVKPPRTALLERQFGDDAVPRLAKRLGSTATRACSHRDPADAILINELRDATHEVRKGNAPKSWIDGLPNQTKTLGNNAIDTVAVLTSSTVG